MALSLVMIFIFGNLIFDQSRLLQSSLDFNRVVLSLYRVLSCAFTNTGEIYARQTTNEHHTHPGCAILPHKPSIFQGSRCVVPLVHFSLDSWDPLDSMRDELYSDCRTSACNDLISVTMLSKSILPGVLFSFSFFFNRSITCSHSNSRLSIMYELNDRTRFLLE